MSEWWRDTVESVRVLGVWRVLWARIAYRPVSRLMHRFDLHYAPAGPLGGKWCKWCGLRGPDNRRLEGPDSTFHIGTLKK